MSRVRVPKLLFIGLAWLCCVSALHAQRQEKYRSQYHFSPNNGWIGDPDGLIHYRGYYHLFWWGHAISPDLVHWTELPYPILGDPGPYSVDSGSSVIDTHNVSGLGVNSFINFHTLTGKHDQRIGASSSTDARNNFTDFHLLKTNPILSPQPAPAEDFRDPQVIWDGQTNSWIMIVTLGDSHRLQFFRSTDLLHWGDRPISTFGPDGDTSAAWECPDLFRLPVDGDPAHSQWVLTVGVSPNRTRYFIGSFDGTTFTNLYPGTILTVDWGPDFYAARTWREYDGPQTATPILGWIGNWRYSRHAPSQLTYGGEGLSSIPRNLALRTYPEGIRLVQTPIPALEQLRETRVSVTDVAISGTHSITDLVPFQPRNNSYEIDATFAGRSTSPFGFHLLMDSSHTHQLTVQYDPSRSTLSVDRTTSSDATLNSYFTAPIPPVPVETVNGQLRLHIFVDMSSIEIFANDGKVVMTLLTYPGENQHGIEVFSGSPIKLARFSAWTLSSIWNGSPAFTIQSGSTYKLQARQDAKVVTAPAKIGAAPLYESDWIDEPTQQWKIDLVEPGAWHDPARWIPPSYRLTNQASGKVMDLRDDLAGDGSVTGLSVWSNRDDQKWQINGVGGGFYTILPKKSSGNGRGQTLEEQSTSLPRVERNGTPLRVGRFLAEHSQEWKLVPAP